MIHLSRGGRNVIFSAPTNIKRGRLENKNGSIFAVNYLMKSYIQLGILNLVAEDNLESSIWRAVSLISILSFLVAMPPYSGNEEEENCCRPIFR